MSRVSPYASIEKRTFQSALVHMLEREYRIIGSQRVLKILAEDVEALVQEFFPARERVESGGLVWTCTGDEGEKAQPGKRTEEYKAVTVVLPLVTAEEVAARRGRCGRGQGKKREQELDKKRLVRLVKAAAEQGGLLTIAELSVILNRSYGVIRRYIKEIEEESGELLPLKGYRMDQGSRPTHKREIARLWEEGLEPPDVARETGHSLKSVERYLKDYERVRMLLKRGLEAEEIGVLIGRGRRVVLEYIEIAREYHPELFTDSEKHS